MNSHDSNEGGCPHPRGPVVLLLVAVVLASPAAVPAQAPVPVRTVEDAARLEEGAVAASIEASGPRLTRILDEVVRRAPGLRRLVVRHRSSAPIEIRSLERIRGLERLEHLSLSGDAFLYDEEFNALGRLTRLTSLHLHLP